LASRGAHPLFVQPDVQADFGYWAKAAHWRPDEAAALSLGFEPKYVNPGTIKPYLEVSSDACEVDRRSMLISRALDKGELAQQFSPADFVRWADRINLELPMKLLDAVTQMAALAKPSGNDDGDLRQEIDRLERELEQCKAANRDTHPRERRSLQIMLASMAYHKYGFDPAAARSPAITLIISDIQLIGQNLDKDTVLTHLRRAFDELDISLPGV
jgi:hypothetical protein